MNCYNCFKEYDGTVCPHCGYDAAAVAGRYPLALPAGSILDGRYIVGRVLGEGGFGITYIAQDYNTKQLVAIKEHFPSMLVTRTQRVQVQLISRSMAEDFQQGKEKFLAEAKTLSQFKGLENICDIYSYFEENGTAYFAMEYVQGVPLDAYIKKLGRTLKHDEALELLMPVMKALGHVHSRGLIHRDISPDNIMVRPEGGAMLIDFGAARYSMGEKSQSLDVVLKHGFAPMEQYTRHGRQGPYTDVYAMAATIYYALSGKILSDAVERSQEDDYKSLTELGIKVPQYFDAAISRALETDYAKRYQSMEDFARALQSPAKAKKGGAALKFALPAAVAAAALAAVLILNPGNKAGNEPTAITAAPAAETVEPAAATAKPEIKETLTENIEPEPVETAIPLQVLASGTDAEGIRWEYTEDCTLSFYGEGPMYNYSAGEETGWRAAGIVPEVKKIVFNEGITDIATFSFKGCTSLEQLVFPDSLRSIGRGAFTDNVLLDNVQLPAGLENLEIAFQDCRSISRITIPKGVEHLRDGTFSNNRALKEVELSEGLKTLSGFSGCTSLSHVVVPEGVTHIERSAFAGCTSLVSVQLPQSLMSIESSAFTGCSALQEITFNGTAEEWEYVEGRSYLPADKLNFSD